MFLITQSFKGYLIQLVIIILLVAGGLFYFFNSYLPDYTRHGQEIAVPALQGQSVEEITSILEKAGLRFEISDSSFVRGEGAGKIIAQNPIAGTSVKANRKIYLTVTSRNPINVEMPDLRNKTYSNALLILSQAGLEPGDTSVAPDDFPIIIKQTYNGNEILPGTILPKFSKIDMVVGDGKGQPIQADSSIN